MAPAYGDRFDGNAWPWRLRDNGPDWDWHVLVDKDEHYVSDACVEGTSEEWRAIARSIRLGTSESFKRCAAYFGEGGAVSFCSPRNTRGGDAHLSKERALELADIIDRALDEYAQTVKGH